ncbi:MAG: phenylalanine--tRNA ligase subunit beta [Candidatus Pacebacteria bacterium]|nr:phenylalanine--tRNA ligase subunit beta [Candidatus Paceibacterota bacterium]MBP9772945.1 phenylalanine--tRNA ligase subunit beta [Candidatus Paceibacterota bacterium]
MKISYNWLKSYIPDICEPDKLWDVFTFHLCEVESMDKMSDGDTIFDINILPNRAHDLLNHQGVAQELSALLDIEYKSPVDMYKIPTSKPTSLEVKIENDKCRRYMGRIVRNVKVGPSPEWVVKHLESVGQKSINNVVDATNIVMFDCGNPTHVFDAKKVGSTIRIKETGSQKKVSLLGGEEKDLKETDLVITDGEDNVLAIAGVKGGTRAEVDENTADIILEVANFDPVTVRKTGRGMGLFTDAIKRFENDLSPVRAEYAMRELSALIFEMCPDAEFEDIVDVFPDKQKWETRQDIEITTDYINKKLGSNFKEEEIENVLMRLRISFRREGEAFVVSPSVLRLDLIGPHDLVEEIGRVLGYDRVLPELPIIDFKPKTNEIFYRILSAKKKLTEDRFREVYTYAFTKKGEVYVAYGAKGKEALRTNLSDGLKQAYELNRLNAPLLGESEIKIFEVGNVFPAAGVEETHVAWMDKKGVQEMTLEEYTKDIEIGSSYDTVLPNSLELKSENFSPWSQYPFIVRDISMWVPSSTTESEVSEIIKENMGNLVVVGPSLVDSFEKEGKKSLAFRLVFQSFDRTLTDVEVAESMNSITKSLQDKGFEIR